MGDGGRHAPGPGAPRVEVLLDGTGTGVAVLGVTIPAGAGMPRHDHGPSSVVLVPLVGSLVVGDGEGDPVELSAGTIGAIDVGEQVQVKNSGEGEARVLVVLSPPDFVESVEAWPGTPQERRAGS